MGIKIHYNSPVILTFFLVSLFALVLGFITKNRSTELFFSVHRSSPASPLTYLRLFTHVLGHANLSHFFGNMTLFLVIGPMLEEKYGSKALLFCILITAFVTGLMHIVFSPHTLLLGASGLVFMMIIMASMAGMKDGEIPLTLIVVSIMYLSKELYSVFFVHDEVANLIHILGGLCGLLLGLIF